MSSPYTLFTFNSKLRRHGLQLTHHEPTDTLAVTASKATTGSGLIVGLICLAIGLGGAAYFVWLLFAVEASVVPNIIFLPFAVAIGYGLLRITSALSHASSNKETQTLRRDAFVYRKNGTEEVIPRERMNRIGYVVDRNSEGGVRKITLTVLYDGEKQFAPIFSVGSTDREDLEYYIGYLNDYYGLA